MLLLLFTLPPYACIDSSFQVDNAKFGWLNIRLRGHRLGKLPCISVPEVCFLGANSVDWVIGAVAGQCSSLDLSFASQNKSFKWVPFREKFLSP